MSEVIVSVNPVASGPATSVTVPPGFESWSMFSVTV
jgi:hypothetical protein